MKLLIDTDPGIDDAVAILYALNRPDVEVLGLTTSAGNVGLDVTTGNALRLVALSGREVPVHAGATAPLLRPGKTEPRVHGADGLGGVVLPVARTEAGTDAVGFLARALMAEPAGSVTLCALAPLTNIARLLREAPQAAARIGRLVAMGGAVRVPGNMGEGAEFNMANDPEAADIVLRAGLPLVLIPLDVTRQVRADAIWLDKLPMTPQASAVRSLVAAYFDRTTDAARPTSRPLHDPCVPVLALRPDLFRTEVLGLAVDCTDGPRAGKLEAGDIAVEVAMGVDGPAVLELLSAGLALPRRTRSGRCCTRRARCRRGSSPGARPGCRRCPTGGRSCSRCGCCPAGRTGRSAR